MLLVGVLTSIHNVLPVLRAVSDVAPDSGWDDPYRVVIYEETDGKD